MLDLIEQEVHRVDNTHRHQDTTQYPHLRKRGFINKEFFFTGTRLGDVDRWPSPLIRKLTIKNNL